MLFGGIIFYYVWIKLLVPLLGPLFGSYAAYKKRKEDWEYEAKYHKNPDLFAARISAQQSLAEKMQEKYNQQVKDRETKLKEKAEQKHQEVENLLNGSDQGCRLGTNKSLRSEYLPLMGPRSSNYRPPKKSKCGGGGCGK